jgi:hypothetical protein
MSGFESVKAVDVQLKSILVATDWCRGKPFAMLLS